MSAELFTVPARMQAEHDDGPPWAAADEHRVRQLNHDLVQVVGSAVKLQHDLPVDRNTLLEILRFLALRKVDDAKDLVPRAADNGGAHGKIVWLTKYEPQVLMETHDLLVRPTRPEQVLLVLRMLDKQMSRGANVPATERLCCTDEPATAPELSEQGRTLWQLVRRAPLELRSAGYVAFASERAAAADHDASLFLQIRDGRALSSGSSQAPASEASSHGSPSDRAEGARAEKRHSRLGGGGQACAGGRQGETPGADS